MSWGGNRDRYESQIFKAIKRGHTSNSKTNTRIEFDGKAQHLSTFEGPRWIGQGTMSFFHWSTRVLEVDFDNDRITDFGLMGYSFTTNRNISGWACELRRMHFIGMRSLELDVWPFDWTLCGIRNPNSPLNQLDKLSCGEQLRVKYRTGAPWVKEINGYPWFHGALFDPAVNENADRVFGEIFKDKVSWHWFTADWMNGLWTKRFIDDAAEKRWRAWRAKRERAA